MDTNVTNSLSDTDCSCKAYLEFSKSMAEGTKNPIDNYSIPFRYAKLQEGVYRFSKSMEFDEFRAHIVNRTFNVYKNNTPFILEFGNIDIELTVFDKENDRYDLGFYICTKSEFGWESYDYSCTHVSFMVNDVEEFMYNALMVFAKEHRLYWSVLN